MPAVLNHQQVEAIQAAIAVVSVYHHGEIQSLEVGEPTEEGIVVLSAVAIPSSPRHQDFPPKQVEVVVNLQEKVADTDGRRAWLIHEGYYSVPVITVHSRTPIKAPLECLAGI